MPYKSIQGMWWTMHLQEQARWAEEREYAKLHPSPPFLYWVIYRKALRTTKRNRGWVFLRDAQASVEEMEEMMRKYGWYLPAFKVSFNDGLVFASQGAAADADILARAAAICQTDYSLKMTKMRQTHE